MKLESLHDLFLNELRDLYDAEKRLVKTLPKMAEASSTPELRDAIQEHLTQTQEHVVRLERIFAFVNEEPKSETCEGIKGIIDEGEDVTGDAKDPRVRDAAIIGSAQKVEHYEIASYGTVRTYARILGLEEAATLLQQTLGEENEADKRLTGIAERQVNVQATRRAG